MMTIEMTLLDWMLAGFGIAIGFSFGQWAWRMTFLILGLFGRAMK